eukprot:12107632-Prorocentrum_lima.AAC.1
MLLSDRAAKLIRTLQGVANLLLVHLPTRQVRLASCQEGKCRDAVTRMPMSSRASLAPDSVSKEGVTDRAALSAALA